MPSYEAGFPKSMYHPQHAPSQMASQVIGESDKKFGPNISGSPMRFPPEMANNSNDEAQLRSRGYLPVGEAPKVTDYHEYPLMLGHPEHVDAVPDRIDAQMVNGAIQTFSIRGSPE